MLLRPGVTTGHLGVYAKQDGARESVPNIASQETISQTRLGRGVCAEHGKPGDYIPNKARLGRGVIAEHGKPGDYIPNKARLGKGVCS